VERGYDTNPSGEGVAGRQRRCSGGRNERDPGAVLADGHQARRGAKRRTTMKEKPNYAELEKKIDFAALAGRIGQLTRGQDDRLLLSCMSFSFHYFRPVIWRI